MNSGFWAADSGRAKVIALKNAAQKATRFMGISYDGLCLPQNAQAQGAVTWPQSHTAPNWPSRVRMSLTPTVLSPSTSPGQSVLLGANWHDPSSTNADAS